MPIDSVKRFNACEPTRITGIVPCPVSVNVSEAARLPKLNSDAKISVVPPLILLPLKLTGRFVTVNVAFPSI